MKRPAKTTDARSLPFKVLIVDDHPMMRLGLKQFLAQENDLDVCGEASNAAEALLLLDQLKPDLILLDVSLDGRSGLDLLKDIRLQHPQVRVLVHSMHDEQVFAERALRLGAHGYLMKQESAEQLNGAIRQILDGKVYVNARLTDAEQTSKLKKEGPTTPIARLSDREFEVFHLIGQGLANQEVAQRLHISIKTVEAHREHIKRKLKVESSTALNLLAVRWAGSEMMLH
jgi:DNA-binding NarL/FixJ family response regulator